MTTATERSIRLNQSHRDDMARAVMAEWEKQNPAPAATGHIALLAIVAEELKKTSSYHRTLRALEVLRADDLDHVALERSILVTITNKQGEARRNLRVCFPISLAKRFGLRGVIRSSPQMNGTDSFAPADLDPSDIASDPSSKSSTTPEMMTVKCMSWIEGNYPSVTIADDCEPMLALEASRKARHEWEKQRDTLGRETRDLLDNFNTTKQLREGWPDIVPYLPPHLADFRGVNLPVLETSRLSERLGINDKESA